MARVRPTAATRLSSPIHCARLGDEGKRRRAVISESARSRSPPKTPSAQHSAEAAGGSQGHRQKDEPSRGKWQCKQSEIDRGWHEPKRRDKSGDPDCRRWKRQEYTLRYEPPRRLPVNVQNHANLRRYVSAGCRATFVVRHPCVRANDCKAALRTSASLKHRGGEDSYIGGAYSAGNPRCSLMARRPTRTEGSCPRGPRLPSRPTPLIGCSIVCWCPSFERAFPVIRRSMQILRAQPEGLSDDPANGTPQRFRTRAAGWPAAPRSPGSAMRLVHDHTGRERWDGRLACPVNEAR